MLIENLNSLTQVEFNSTFTFESVDVGSMNSSCLSNDNGVEIYVYSASINGLLSAEEFFARYLKLSYIDLFDGEPESDLKEAYENIISKYNLKLKSIEIDELQKKLYDFLGEEKDSKIEGYIDNTVTAYSDNGYQNIFLLVTQDEMVLVDCDYE